MNARLVMTAAVQEFVWPADAPEIVEEIIAAFEKYGLKIINKETGEDADIQSTE